MLPSSNQIAGAEGSGSRRRGFKTQTEFSTAEGDKYIESPLQRLQRLKAETKQFLDDVEAVSKETKAPIDQGVSAQELAAELKTMLAQLDAQLENERLQHVRRSVPAILPTLLRFGLFDRIARILVQRDLCIWFLTELTILSD